MLLLELEANVSIMESLSLVTTTQKANSSFFPAFSILGKLDMFMNCIHLDARSVRALAVKILPSALTVEMDIVE